MNRKLLFSCLLALLTATWVSSCKDDDDNNIVPAPVAQGAKVNVLVVFAPSQLGDNGYADNVLEGVRKLESYKDSVNGDTIDAHFVSTYNFDATLEWVKSWAIYDTNPFYGNKYERRLLVFTEPFMINWIESFKDSLQQTDDILMLRTPEHVVDSVAEALGLGDRLHGLSISMAAPVRKFCHYVDSLMEWINDDMSEYVTVSNVNRDYMPIFRLYSCDEVAYADSVDITFEEMWGEDTEMEEIPLSSLENEGLFPNEDGGFGTSLTTLAYNWADRMAHRLEDYGNMVAVVDLGTASMGWDYYIFGQTTIMKTLMLNSLEREIGRRNILCRYDNALTSWVLRWMHTPEMLKRMEWHGGWDGYCEDDILDVVGVEIFTTNNDDNE